MPPLKRLPCRLIAAAVSALAFGSLRAELLKVSPFMPPQSAANAPTQNAPLEYRGSMEINDVEQFRVIDPVRKVGTWLKVGEHDANLDVTLKQYDAAHDTITLEHGGQPLTLQMKVPKVVSSGSASTMMPLPPQPMPMPGNVSPAVIQTVVPNPTPADEQRRLEAVAAEVARRRALREQAAQQAQRQAAPNTGMPMQPTRQDYQQAQQQLMQRPQRR